MGTSPAPAPALALYFAFFHEFSFLNRTVPVYKTTPPQQRPLYPSDFHQTIPMRNEKNVDDILSAHEGRIDELELSHVIMDVGIYEGIYPDMVHNEHGHLPHSKYRLDHTRTKWKQHTLSRHGQIPSYPR